MEKLSIVMDDNIEEALKAFEGELIKVIDRFEKENGVLMVDIKYDGYNKSVNYTISGGNYKFTFIK